MRSTERPEFEKLVGALLAGYDRKVTPDRTEAYWRGCNRMPLGTFERAVDRALSEDGPDDIPSPKRMWTLARELRINPAREPERQTPKTGAELVACYANSLLLSMLLGAGKGSDGEWTKVANGRPASNASLQALIDAKRKIVASAVVDPDITGAFETPMTKRTPHQIAALAELRDVLTAAYERHWSARTAQETAADFDHYARTFRVRDEFAAGDEQAPNEAA